MDKDEPGSSSGMEAKETSLGMLSSGHSVLFALRQRSEKDGTGRCRVRSWAGWLETIGAERFAALRFNREKTRLADWTAKMPFFLPMNAKHHYWIEKKRIYRF